MVVIRRLQGEFRIANPGWRSGTTLVDQRPMRACVNLSTRICSILIANLRFAAQARDICRVPEQRVHCAGSC